MEQADDLRNDLPFHKNPGREIKLSLSDCSSTARCRPANSHIVVYETWKNSHISSEGVDFICCTTAVDVGDNSRKQMTVMDNKCNMNHCRWLFTFCSASSSNLRLFSSCLAAAAPPPPTFCSSSKRLVDTLAFSYSSCRWAWSSRAFLRALSASCWRGGGRGDIIGNVYNHVVKWQPSLTGRGQLVCLAQGQPDQQLWLAYPNKKEHTSYKTVTTFT